MIIRLNQSANRLVAAFVMLIATVAVATAQSITKVTLTPNTVVGGSPSVGKVTLSSKVGKEGADIMLTSSSGFAYVLHSVHLAAGATSASFNLTTVAVGGLCRATISASLGNSNATDVLTIKPPTLTAFTIAPKSVYGGTAATGTVTISSIAPPNGLGLYVTSDSPNATVIAALTIPGGTKSTTFAITTLAVPIVTTAKIKVTFATTSISVPLSINPPVLSGFTLKPTSVTAGFSSVGTLTITGPAPISEVKVNLTSSDPSVTVPATVKIKKGAKSATFDLSTRPITKQIIATITAKSGTAKFTSKLTILVNKGSKFAGSFEGVYFNTSPGSNLPSVGRVYMNISSAGAVTGTSSNWQDAFNDTIGGTVSTEGTVSLTFTENGQTTTGTGTVSITGAGILSGDITVSDGSPAHITLNRIGNPLMFVGQYSGTFANADSHGTVTLTVSADGSTSGSANNITSGKTVTLVGTLSSVGYVTVTATNPDNTTKFSAGGAGLDPNGNLVLIIMNTSDQSPTVITLKRA